MSTPSPLAGMIAVSLCAWFPAAASSGSSSRVEGPAAYVPIQSISYEFGSKSMSGYFLQQGATCLVTLLIIEKINPEQPLPLSAARLRLTLNPGQIAGLDSEEGRSLNFTCGEGAATLLVDVGERSQLMSRQAGSMPSAQSAFTPKKIAARDP